MQKPHNQDFQSLKHLLSERGISIIVSLTIIAFMISFIADLMVSSRVANQMTLDLLGGSRAEYLAKSAEKLATFLLTVDHAVDLKTQQMMKTPATDAHDEVWSMLSDIPIGGENTDMLKTIMEMFGLKEFTDSQVMQKLKEFQGSFTLNIEDESSRINLSFLQTTNMGKQTLEMLMKLLSCPAEEHFLETKSLSAEELAHRIFDFIDKDKRSSNASGFTSEIAPYRKKDPPYNPPNHPLESIDQLQLIEGWDRDIHAVFAPYLTVYPIANQYSNESTRKLGAKAQLNLNTVSRELMQCLLPETQEDCYSDFVRAFHNMSNNKQRLASGENEIATTLAKLCYITEQVREPMQKEKWFKTHSSTFRIIAKGESGGSKRVITSVIHRLPPKFMQERQRSSSVDMLYWRIGAF